MWLWLAQGHSGQHTEMGELANGAVFLVVFSGHQGLCLPHSM